MDVNKILVPTDFSDFSKKALQYARELAKPNDAEIVLIHVIEPTIYPVGQVIRPGGFPNPHEQVREFCEHAMKELENELEGAKTRSLLVEGVPVTGIIEAARDLNVDLIVIATHGHTGLKHMFLGSTAEKVVRNATCPVLTVRDEG